MKTKAEPRLLGALSAVDATPQHDALCLWVQEQALRLFDPEAEAVADRASFYRKAEAEEYAGILEFETQHRRPPHKVEVLWEQPVFSPDRYRPQIVGYVDLVVRVSFHVLLGTHTDKADEYRWGRSSCLHLVEVKSSIPSLGALLRQLNTYKVYSREEARLWVVSPDTRYADQIRAQGYGFIEAPKNEEEVIR